MSQLNRLLFSNYDNSNNNVIIKFIKNPDRALVAMILTLIAIWGLIPDQFLSTVIFVGQNLWNISLYLMISIFLAGYIKATEADRLIGAAFSSNANVAIIMAATIGAFAPFCSCGVVPLIAALLTSGVPLAPVMAFLIASPIIDPQMAILTAGILGFEFAIAKISAAVLIGLMGGYAVVVVQKMGGFKDFLSKDVKATYGTSTVVESNKPNWKFWQIEGRPKAFMNEILRTTWFLGKWLSIAFILEGLMIANIPMAETANWLTTIGTWAIPAAALVGCPLYITGYAGIPLADGLMKIGLSAPAALSFMVAGGATCIPAAIAVKALVKMPVLLLYLGVAVVGSISVGFIYAGWLVIM